MEVASTVAAGHGSDGSIGGVVGIVAKQQGSGGASAEGCRRSGSGAMAAAGHEISVNEGGIGWWLQAW